MTIQDHYEALVQSHRELDPVLTAAIERGGRMRRRRRHLAGTATAVVVVAALGMGISAFTSRPPTKVTTAAETHEPKGSTQSTPVAPSRAASRLRLQASDWQTSSRNGARSTAAGARYTVLSAGGQVLEQGAIGTFGEAIITIRAASVTISVDRCKFEGAVDHLRPAETSIVGFPCGSRGNELPPQVIPKSTGNPTDDELRAANQEAITCIEAAGLTVSNADLTVDGSGHVSRGIQISLADSGLTFDEADAVQASCEKHYLSLMFARGDWLDDHGG